MSYTTYASNNAQCIVEREAGLIVPVSFVALFLCLRAIDNGTCGVGHSDAIVYCMHCCFVSEEERMWIWSFVFKETDLPV